MINWKDLKLQSLEDVSGVLEQICVEQGYDIDKLLSDFNARRQSELAEEGGKKAKEEKLQQDRLTSYRFKALIELPKMFTVSRSKCPGCEKDVSFEPLLQTVIGHVDTQVMRGDTGWDPKIFEKAFLLHHRTGMADISCGCQECGQRLKLVFTLKR